VVEDRWYSADPAGVGRIGYGTAYLLQREIYSHLPAIALVVSRPELRAPSAAAVHALG
jgi:hypothetical protein